MDFATSTLEHAEVQDFGLSKETISTIRVVFSLSHIPILVVVLWIDP